ncbi:MAG: DNA adenine methylase [Lentisphaerae bacterium]|nr:DNA adenine methylase [Lentisphaerota bacterium]
MRSPLNYLGGKSRLVKTIVPLIPKDHVCYCEAFCGAAWVLFAKEPSKVEVINDADSELATFWRVLQNHYEPFVDLFKWAVVGRKIFEWEKAKRPETLTDLQRAARYFYLQKCCFGGHVTGRTFGATVTRPSGLNLSSIEEDLLKIHWRLERVAIENLDALDCLRRYDRPTTFFYLDPPYYHTAGYAVPWPDDRYEELAAALACLKGRFILSLNDCPEVRQIFSAFRFRRVSTKYSLKSGLSADHGRDDERHEVLIRGRS